MKEWSESRRGKPREKRRRGAGMQTEAASDWRERLWSQRPCVQSGRQGGCRRRKSERAKYDGAHDSRREEREREEAKNARLTKPGARERGREKIEMRRERKNERSRERKKREKRRSKSREQNEGRASCRRRLPTLLQTTPSPVFLLLRLTTTEREEVGAAPSVRHERQREREHRECLPC